MPIPVAARSKTWVCGCSLAGIADSNAAEGMGGLTLDRRNPTECGVSECDREAPAHWGLLRRGGKKS
jgi:hypothetical protein